MDEGNGSEEEEDNNQEELVLAQRAEESKKGKNINMSSDRGAEAPPEIEGTTHFLHLRKCAPFCLVSRSFFRCPKFSANLAKQLVSDLKL